MEQIPEKMQPNENWTDTEKWVWEKVSQGKDADFNENLGAKPEPSNPNDWKANRLISGSFLHSILLTAAYRSIPSHRGIRITGAWIKDPIDLSKGQLATELWLASSRFEGKVDLSRAQAADFISFHRSFFAGDLDMGRLQSKDGINLSGTEIRGQLNLYSASIERDLELGQGLQCSLIDLRNAGIQRTVIFNRVKTIGSLLMSGISVGRDLYMRKEGEGEMVFEKINMVAAEIEGQFELNGATIRDECNMNGIATRQDLFIYDSTIECPLKLTGAVVGGDIILDTVHATNSIEASGLAVNKCMNFSRVEALSVDLAGGKIGEQLEIKGCRINETLDMTCLSVGSYCEFDIASEQEEYDDDEKTNEDKPTAKTPLEIGQILLSGGQIGDDLSFYSLQNNILLDLSSITVKGRLKLKEKDSGYKMINMRFAQINGAVELFQITVDGPFNLNNISVGASLSINKTHLQCLKMVNARIGNSFELMDVELKDELDIQFAHVNRNIFIRRGIFPARLRIGDSNINGSIITSSSAFSFLDLGGTTVQGELEIGDNEGKNIWTGTSGLNLRNTKVFALSDAGKDSWPDFLELDEFAYTSLITGSWGSGTNGDIVNRRADWFIKWLAKDQTYSSQPYNYLARTLNKSGYSELANRVLFAAKERERKMARKKGRWEKWIGFTLLKITIGYGYGWRYFISLIWVFAIVLVGFYVVGTVHTGKMHNASVLDRVGFSLDMLLPVIELNDKYKLDFHGWQLLYFYLHKVMGFILSSFVLAGLAGITKREAKE